MNHLLRLLRVERLEDRTTPAGLDPSFGDGGRVRLPIDQPGSNDFDEVNDVAALPDGRVLFAGLTQFAGGNNYDAVVGRLLPDGTPDQTFSGHGFTILDRIWFPRVRLAALPDGGAVVAAEGWHDGEPGRFIRVARLTAGGDLDPTFGDGGVAEFLIPFSDPTQLAGVNAVAVDAGGRVLLAGPVNRLVGDRFDTDFGVLRLTADGRPDPAFGPGGLRAVGFDLTPGPDVDRPTELAVLPDGRVLVAGAAAVGSGESFPSFFTAFAVARLTAGGDLDPTFGDGGKLWFEFPGTSAAEPSAMAVLPDGGVLLAGRANRYPPVLMPIPWWSFAAARVTADGRLDPAFGQDGRVTVGGPEWFRNGSVDGVGVLPDGKVVLAGQAARPSPLPVSPEDVAAVVRLNPDGTPDAGFGSGGLFAFPFAVSEGASGSAIAAAVFPDGRTLLGGSVSPTPGSPSDLGFAVVLPDPGPTALDLSYPPEWDSPSKTEPEVPPPTPPEPPVPPLPPPSVRPPLVPVPPDEGVVTADVTGDGIADIVMPAGPTGSLLRVLNGADGSELVAFAPFEAGFTGRLRLAAADLDGDGKAEVIVAAGAGGAPRVTVFRGADLAAGVTTAGLSFFGIGDPAFRGGAGVAVADLTGDGAPDLVVTAGAGGGPRVAVWDGRSIQAGSPGLVADFFAFEASFRGGVVAAAGDATGDGRAELALGAGGGGAPRVRLLDGRSLLAAPVATAGASVADFFAFDPSQRGGVRVAFHDTTGSGKADLLAGSGAGEPAEVRMFQAAGLMTSPTPPPARDLDPSSPALAGVFVG
jgi:uncharacterized delta-60 repeat protein